MKKLDRLEVRQEGSVLIVEAESGGERYRLFAGDVGWGGSVVVTFGDDDGTPLERLRVERSQT